MSALFTAAFPLAWHHDGWHHGGWWVIFPILWFALLTLSVSFVRHRGGRGHGDAARQILGERFARGELSPDEYRDRLSELR